MRDKERYTGRQVSREDVLRELGDPSTWAADSKRLALEQHTHFDETSLHRVIVQFTSTRFSSHAFARVPVNGDVLSIEGEEWRVQRVVLHARGAVEVEVSKVDGK